MSRILFLTLAFAFVAGSPAWADHKENHERKWNDAKGLPEDVLDQLDDEGMRGINQQFIDNVAPHQSITRCNPASEFMPDFVPSPAWDAWNVGPEEYQNRSDLKKTEKGELFHPWVLWELRLQGYCEVIFNVDEEGVPIGSNMAARCTLAPYIPEALLGVQSMRFEPASRANAGISRNRIVQPIEFCHRSPAFS